MSDENKAKGCLVGLLSLSGNLFITMPLWLVLMFGILSRIEAPTWMWVVFWVYAPALYIVAVGSTMLATLAKSLLDD